MASISCVLVLSLLQVLLVRGRLSSTTSTAAAAGNEDHASSSSSSSSSSPGHFFGNDNDLNQTSRRTATATTVPSMYVPANFEGLDENFLKLAYRAATLSGAVNKDDTVISKLYPTARSWTNEPDKALIVQLDDDGICWIAFRATTWTADDWAQNLNPRYSESVCRPDSSSTQCCTTRQGFEEAYQETNYWQALQDSLDECVSGSGLSSTGTAHPACPNGQPCPVVLTGTSQGGAIAQVAAVYLQNYNPTVITFGQPPTMNDGCTAMDSNRLYRFVNTVINDQGLLKYDAVPFLGDNYFGRSIDHSGHLFVLHEQDNQQVAYYRNLYPMVGSGDLSFWDLQEAHTIDSTLERIETFLEYLDDSNNVVIQLDGWQIGSSCTRNSECMSPRICSGQSHKCSSGLVGDACWLENDCLQPDYTCEGVWNPTCQAKLNSGRGCNESTDCKSGRCNSTWRGLKCA